MTEEQILQTIRPIIAKRLRQTETAITDKTNFAKDLGADSIDMADIIMFSESALNCTVPNECYKTIETVHDLVVCLFCILNPKQSLAVLWLAVSNQKRTNSTGKNKKIQRTR